MPSIGFDCGPFHIYLGAGGHYGIAAHELPWAHVGPLPGLLEHGRAEALNETWDDEGKKPHLLESVCEEMPDLEDPRVEKCLRAYVEKHWEFLQLRYEQAKQRWHEMQQQPIKVGDVLVRPGQRVFLYLPSERIRQKNVCEGVFTFLALSSDSGRGVELYLQKDGQFVSYLFDQPGRFWVELVDA